jgi:hypothetical protein
MYDSSYNLHRYFSSYKIGIVSFILSFLGTVKARTTISLLDLEASHEPVSSPALVERQLACATPN